jgi:putative Mg2+ transporter-C (MgtC) family protein
MQPDLTLEIMFKLAFASLLGGMIGIEREVHHKPAGLRTNIFICVGSALFTILSYEVAVRFGARADGARIAAQLIPGIGFIGAGAILRDRGNVTGLTTAATIFVNASMGMAVGAGMFWTAGFSALMILGALSVLGWLEERLLKKRAMTFRVMATDPEPAMKMANTTLRDMELSMQHFQIFRVGSEFVMEFEAEVTRWQQLKLLEQLGQLGVKCEAAPYYAAHE